MQQRRGLVLPAGLDAENAIRQHDTNKRAAEEQQMALLKDRASSAEQARLLAMQRQEQAEQRLQLMRLASKGAAGAPDGGDGDAAVVVGAVQDPSQVLAAAASRLRKTVAAASGDHLADSGSDNEGEAVRKVLQARAIANAERKGLAAEESSRMAEREYQEKLEKMKEAARAKAEQQVCEFFLENEIERLSERG